MARFYSPSLNKGSCKQLEHKKNKNIFSIPANLRKGYMYAAGILS